MSSATFLGAILFWIFLITQADFLKDGKYLKIFNFFGQFLYKVQVVIFLHKNVKQISPYKYQFYLKNEKNVKIVKIAPFLSQSEEGRMTFSMLIGYERARSL